MDNDLKAYLDQRFLAIEQQNQQLRHEVGEQNQHLRQEIQEVGQEVNQRLDRVETAVQGAHGLIEDLQGEVRGAYGLIEDLQGEVRGAYVLIEDLQGKVQLIAEGVANCNEQLKRHDDKVSLDLAEIKSFNRVSYQDLDVRVRRLEAANTSTESLRQSRPR